MTDHQPDEPMYRVSAYFQTPDEQALVESILGQDQTFASVVEGTATSAELDRLGAAGVVVEVLPTPPIDESPSTVYADETVAEPEGEQTVGLLEDHVGSLQWPDPGPQHAYWVQLAGPITQEQRLELDRMNVDLAAFEPPDRYRTILTSDQVEQVRGLSYVRSVAPYRLSEKVTKELVNLVGAERDDRPALAGDEDNREQLQVFDVLLHRERDLPEIQGLIDGSPKTTILGTSNLRIRFGAPVDLPLLGTLAGRVEVRRLDVFKAPRI
jgi:hypothetical protein